MTRSMLMAAILCALPALAVAQKPVTMAESVELAAQIQAIDKTSRMITLKVKDGDVRTIHAGPEVKRFDELKVGDTVNIRYYESAVFQIRKPGQPVSMPAGGGDPKIVRGTGARPSATSSRQETITVTVKAIDAKAPSVTVLTPDGRTVSMKVEDPKNLKGLAVGDKVEITYTEAYVLSVK
jgi:Cu/Ag efflux protein CusF